MNRRRLIALLLAACAALLLAAFAAWSYVPRDPTGLNFHRTDFANIQFLVNESVKAGLVNAEGKLWITADSDPAAAISAACGTWSGIPTSGVRFAPLKTTTALNDPLDNQPVVVFSDTPDVRSLLGSSVLAATLVFYTIPDGVITDSDILFNPLFTFSTTFAGNTPDLQAVMTHELGHALGANHSNVLGSAMFQTTNANDIHQRSLTSDDMAFVSSLYPAAGGNGYATVTGKATLGDGPARGSMIALVDPATGITVGGFASLTDGSYKVQAPPGNYRMYVEPLSGYVLPGNLYIPAGVPVDTNFQPSFLGGNDNPSAVNLGAGDEVTLNLSAVAGSAPFQAPFLAVGAAGGANEALTFHQGPVSISSGQAADLLIGGPGVDPLTDQNLQILGGGIAIRPGTLRKDASNVNGFPVYRVTLDIAAAASNTLGTVILRKGSSIATLTGAIAVGKPQTVNAGSFLGGAVSAGEVVSFFGPGAGPSKPASGKFDATGTLASSTGNVSVTFDGIAAPVFYASSDQINIQVPYEVAGRQFTKMAVTNAGRSSGQFALPVRTAHPGIIVVTRADNSPVTSQSPVSAGDVVVVWATGAGVTSVPARTGKPSPSNSTVPATVTIGGISTTPSYAGLTPGGVGLMQVNVTIPDGIAPGNSVPLKFSIAGNETQTVNIAMR